MHSMETNNKKVILDKLSENYLYFYELSYDVQKDLNIVKAALINESKVLSYEHNSTSIFSDLDSSIKLNKSFILYVLEDTANPYFLNHLDPTLRKDKEFIFSLLNTFQNYNYNYKTIINNIDKSLFEDRIFVQQLCSITPNVIEYFPYFLKNDREFIKPYLKEYSFILNYLSEEIREDKQFILENFNISADPQFLSHQLRKDKDICLKIVETYKLYNCLYINKDFLNDKDFILHALNFNPLYLTELNDTLLLDYDILHQFHQNIENNTPNIEHFLIHYSDFCKPLLETYQKYVEENNLKKLVEHSSTSSKHKKIKF